MGFKQTTIGESSVVSLRQHSLFVQWHCFSPCLSKLLFTISVKIDGQGELYTMSVKIDGQEEPVDMECAYVSFCYEIKLEPSGT